MSDLSAFAKISWNGQEQLEKVRKKYAYLAIKQFRICYSFYTALGTMILIYLQKHIHIHTSHDTKHTEDKL